MVTHPVPTETEHGFMHEKERERERERESEKESINKIMDEVSIGIYMYVFYGMYRQTRMKEYSVVMAARTLSKCYGEHSVSMMSSYWNNG